MRNTVLTLHFISLEMVEWPLQVDNEVFSIYIVIPGATAEKPIQKDVVKSQLIN